MNKYENGKIYRIVCNTTNKNYYGSTTQPLSKRLYDHKAQYKKYLIDKKQYYTAFEIIKEDNFDIILVEIVNCSCKLELEKRERFYIDNNECVNKCTPTCGRIESNKKYREKHKDKAKEYAKEYREKYSEEKKEQEKERLKKYRETHREQERERQKLIYQKKKVI